MRKKEGEGQEGVERGTCSVIPSLMFHNRHVGEARRRELREAEKVFHGWFCHLDATHAHLLGLAIHIMPQGINPSPCNP